MTDSSDPNIIDSVVMGSVFNLSEVHNLIVNVKPAELANEIDNILLTKIDSNYREHKINFGLKTQVEAFKQQNNDKILDKYLTKWLLMQENKELNDHYLQRIVARDLIESYWILYGNLMLKHGENWYSEYYLEEHLLNDAIESARNLSLTALKMNDQPFAVLCKVRSMSTLSSISALNGEIELAEKYGLEAINIWEKYGDDFFSKCGSSEITKLVMAEEKLDLFFECQVVYGAYHQILILQPPGDNRFSKLIRHLDAHPISIFTCSVDSSSPMWSVISRLPEFSNLPKFKIKKHYKYWMNQAKLQGCEEDMLILQEILSELS